MKHHPTIKFYFFIWFAVLGMTFVVAAVFSFRVIKAGVMNPINALTGGIEKLSETIFVIDVDTFKFCYANPAAAKLTGYTVAECIGMSLADISSEEYFISAQAILMEDIEACRESGLNLNTSKKFEAPIKRKDGIVVWVECAHSYLRDDSSKINGILVVCRDITKRKEAERSRSEKHSPFQINIESVTDMIWGIDLKTMIVCDASSSVKTILGYKRNEIIGLPLEKLFTLESYGLIMKVLTKILARVALMPNFTRELVLEQVHKDGRSVWTEVIISFHLGKSGKPEKMIGVTRDITKSKEEEDILRTNEESMRALLNITTRSITMIDTVGTILVINENEAKSLGLRLENAVGHSIYEYYPPDIVALRSRMIAEVLKTGKNIYFDEVFKNSVYETHIYPVFDKRGGIDRLAIYSRDISRQRRLEKEILDISEKERIRIGNDLHDGIGQYFTGIGYMVKLLVNRLHENKMPEAIIAEEIMGLIKEAKTHISTLSKGLSPVHMDKNGLSSALRELCISIEKIYNISCTLVYDEEIDIGDNAVATHIYFIVREAVNNSVKHSNAGKIEIALLLRDGTLAISITDNGTGFDVNYKEKEGLGLDLMRYRSNIIGAVLTIGVDDAGRTMIACTLNVKDVIPAPDLSNVI